MFSVGGTSVKVCQVTQGIDGKMGML